ncbi:MAG: helix-turn-helix domain-containing protein [Saprospiraceae bacterium]
METEEWIGLLLYMFLFANALLLGLLFLTIKSENRKANIYLGLFLWSIVLQIFNDFLSELSVEEEFGISFIIEPFLFYLLFLFFYLHKTINQPIKKWYYLLFIPGIFHNVLLHFDGLFLTENDMTIYETFFYFMEIGLIVYAFRILQNHQKKISDFYSDLEYKSLSWLKSIFTLVILIHFSNFSTIVFDLSNVEFIEYVTEYTSFGLFVFLLYWIAYNGFSQSEIFKQRLFFDKKNNVNIEVSNAEKTEETILEKAIQKPDEVEKQVCKEELICSEKDLQQFNKIKSQIQQQELFTNPKLNLRILSEALDLKEKELSRLINECGKVNFYQFINEFRIEKFKQLLQSPKANQLTFSALATEAGFSSKSTFYAVFKKLEGMTPKQYEKSLKKSI